MNRRTTLVAVLAPVVAVAGALIVADPALAALREVRVGNFYYDDATPGDGKVEVDQGDQLRFTVLDGGPGTPHTVEIDEFGIHSGSLASGETYTTPPLDRPGTYSLYCKPHQNRGHQATLIIRARNTATTSAPTTAAPTTAAPATTAPATAAPPPGSPTVAPPATTTPNGVSPGTPTTSPTSDDATGTPASGDEPAAGEAAVRPAESTDTTLAPVGRGEADADVLAAAPVDPDSLQAAIGRPAARTGPWTRSVRLGAIVFILMAAAAGAAMLKGRRLHEQGD